MHLLPEQTADAEDEIARWHRALEYVLYLTKTPVRFLMKVRYLQSYYNTL